MAEERQTVPVDRLYHVTIVAKDAREAARQHARFFGIRNWSVTEARADRLSDTRIFGRRQTAPPALDLNGVNPTPGQYSFRTATGTSDNGAITFQIVEPTGGLSTFEEFLATRGPGIHGLCMTVVDAQRFERLRVMLAGKGVPLAQAYTLAGAARFYDFDTRKLLGGFYLQVVVPLMPDWQAKLPVDEEWDFGAEIGNEDAARLMAGATGITHLGVIVRDVREAATAFADLFGQPIWRGMHWRTEKGSLEDTTNNGKPVVHSYFTARADLWKNEKGVPFGFEIVQPCLGPSHYKEDFLIPLGPGIHHMDVRVPMKDWSQWETLERWVVEDRNAPNCMSGWLRNHSALFQYHDTRAALGYVTELVAPPRGAPPTKGWPPDYWYDFSGLEK